MTVDCSTENHFVYMYMYKSVCTDASKISSLKAMCHMNAWWGKRITHRSLQWFGLVSMNIFNASFVWISICHFVFEFCARCDALYEIYKLMLSISIISFIHSAANFITFNTRCKCLPINTRLWFRFHALYRFHQWQMRVCVCAVHVWVSGNSSPNCGI